MLAALTPMLMSCAEPPSYELRWTLVDKQEFADPSQAAPLSSVQQCSQVGVSKIRVTTRRLDNSVADRREYPCFPGAFERGEWVGGPSLEPGEYKLEVEGLRRSGGDWACIDDPNLPGPEPCVAFAEAAVTVVDGGIQSVELVLLSPPQCDDGVDNDGDGRVDSNDFACFLNPDGAERTDDSLAVFQIQLSFLGSAAVFPVDVAVDSFRLAIDGEPLAEISADDLVTSQWPFRLPLLSESLEPGDAYELSIVALDQDGAALTAPKVESFSVPTAGFAPLFDFSGQDFLEPIIEPFSVTVGMRLNPDDLTGPPCALAGFVDGAPVTIERTWFRVVDDQGVPLDAATLGLTGSSSEGPIVPIDELADPLAGEGWVSFACPSSMLVSTPLLWGNYAVEIQSRIGESVCFESAEALELAPLGQSGAQGLLLERVIDAMGVPPPGCEECVVTSDCSGQVCDAGICKDK